MCICLNPFQIAQVFIEFSKSLVNQFTEVFCGPQTCVHGLRKMFETRNVDFMKVVNEIYTRFEGFDRIKQAYYDYVLEEGENVINKYKN